MTHNAVGDYKWYVSLTTFQWCSNCS